MQQESYKLLNKIDSRNGKLCNVVVSANTGTGKTNLVVMYGKDVLDSGKKVIYMGPSKALVEQKLEEWADTNHPWSNKKIAIVTGDYVWNDKLEQEVKDADVVIITPESMLSKIYSGKNSWLADVGLVAIDEIHTLGDSSRGPNLEASLIQFFNNNTIARLLGLSGTLKNIKDISEFFSGLNDRETLTVESNYRPVPIVYSFVSLPVAGGRYKDSEIIVEEVLRDISEKPHEQYLVFVFNKYTGNKLVEALKEEGYKAEFHHAGVSKTVRKMYESSFMNRSVNILVATTTLAAGVNLPARNVIVTATEAGGNYISASDLMQCAGRAGRKGIDTEGFVKFYTREGVTEREKKRLTEGEDVVSNFLTDKNFAPHFLGGVSSGYFNCPITFENWYKKTLSHVQNKSILSSIVQEKVTKISETLIKMKLLEKDIVDKWAVTFRGKISVQYMIDPIDFFNLLVNFSNFTRVHYNPSVAEFSAALAKIPSQKKPSLNQWEYKEINQYMSIAKKYVDDKYIVSFVSYYCKLTNKNIPESIFGKHLQNMQNIGRYATSLLCVAQKEGWSEEAQDMISLTPTRFMKGITWDEAKIHQRFIKKNERVILSKYGIYNPKEFAKNLQLVKNEIGENRCKEILKQWN